MPSTSAPRDPQQILTDLHTGLTARRTPQDVAADLLHLPAVRTQLDKQGRSMLTRLAGTHGAGIGSSMTSTYRHHPGLQRPYVRAETALRAVTDAAGLPAVPAADPTDPASLNTFLTAATTILGLQDAPLRPVRTHRARKATTHTYTMPAYDFWGDEDDLDPGDLDLGDVTRSYTTYMPRSGRRRDRGGHVDGRHRYDAQQRRTHLPGVSVRTYRRAVSTLEHLQQRTAVLSLERSREAATAYGKSRLAHTITFDDFVADQPTAAFVAYYTARLGMRTQFTSGPQERPMDTLADALLHAALNSPTCRPDVLATVVTHQQILNRLTIAERSQLLVATWDAMTSAAHVLQATYDPHRRDMVVRAGDDSSSWNLASRAFNQARTGWLNLTTALGLSEQVATHIPGKVPALIAADVAAWHRLEGGAAHVDQVLFTQLPAPWDVVLHATPCSADLIRATCAAHDIDADDTGWTAGYRQDGLQIPTAAPDLVHGVVIAHPVLATILRHAGAYCGQG